MKLFVISVGVVNMTSGMTQYDWSIYENNGLHAFLTDRNYMLFGCKGSLEIGDNVEIFNDQSRKSLGANQSGKVIDICPCEKDALLTMLKKQGYDYYPIRSFAKRTLTEKLKTSYVIK